MFAFKKCTIKERFCYWVQSCVLYECAFWPREMHLKDAAKFKNAQYWCSNLVYNLSRSISWIIKDLNINYLPASLAISNGWHDACSVDFRPSGAIRSG